MLKNTTLLSVTLLLNASKLVLCSNNSEEKTTRASPWIAILLTFFSGVSLCIGACLPLLDRMTCIQNRFLSWRGKDGNGWKMLQSRAFLAGSLGFASGIMIYGTFASIVPEAVTTLSESSSIGNPKAAYLIALAYASAGGIFMWLIDLIINKLEDDGDSDHVKSPENANLELDNNMNNPLCPCQVLRNERSPSVKSQEYGLDYIRSSTTTRNNNNNIENDSTDYADNEKVKSTDMENVKSIIHPHKVDVEEPASEGGKIHNQHVTELSSQHKDVDDDDYDDNEDDGPVKIPKGALPVWQIVIAISLHKIPEGLVTYTSAVTDFKFGALIALAMLIHSLPEGIMAVLPVYYATKSVSKSVSLICVVAGLAQPLGGLIGFAIIGDGTKKQESDKFAMDPHVLGAFYGVVAGMQTVISMHSMLPVAISQNRRYAARFLISGVIFTALTFGIFDIVQ